MRNSEQKIAELKKELAVKNRELEIESALERVRSVAMRMKMAEDMLKICRTLSLQLQKLGIKEIRNVQTAIFYPQRGNYVNYEYYAKHKRTFITDTSYTNHKWVKAWAVKMLNGKDRFFIKCIKGKSVKDWVAYQKTTNVFIDKYLSKASSLNYYWYSLGPVALGISTYYPLKTEEIELFKRFVNVFELTYLRYLDIEKAEVQTREAQIEASLERVRAVAMGMRKPDDLLNICEILYKELCNLGFDELRNAMINIHDDEKESFLDYDYSDVIGKSVTLLNYNAHPAMEKQIKQSRKANDAFSEAVYKGRDLQAWKEFRRKYGEKDDPRIKKTTALYYYFYSVGTGTIGISTFYAIGDEKLLLLKRFRNVFNLAYQRYSDIASAEAQAREAQIEAALERVRSRTAAMQKSEELKEVIQMICEQMNYLGIEMASAGFMIDYKKSNDFNLWRMIPFQQHAEFLHIPYFDHPIFRLFIEAKEKGLDFYPVTLTKEEKDTLLTHFVSQLADYPEDRKKLLYDLPGYADSHVLMNNIGLYIQNYTGIPYSDADNAILMRFGKAFEQTYTRFIDLQKAEAQVREAQIEAALERVRAKAMAMHSSDDLGETVDTFFSELNKLNIIPHRCGVGITDPITRIVDIRATTYTKENVSKKIVGKLRLAGHPVLDKIFETWKQQKEYHPVLRGKEILEYYKVMNPQVEFPDFANDDVQYGHYFNFKEGGVFAWTDKELSENDIQIFRRFTSVLSLTYRRYLDLKEAEAQTRDALIEAALEKVRSRSMGMQKSDELKEVIQLVYEQFVHLNIHIEHTGFILDYKVRDDLHIWLADQHLVPQEITIPCFDSPPNNSIKEAKEKGQDFFKYLLTFEEKNRFYQDLFQLMPGVPEEAIEYYLNCPGLAGSGVLLENVGLYIENFSGTPYTDEENNTLMRFGKVFQQTYTRFLDLQKAEAQARESEIQLALERVRARTMAMQKSEELAGTARVLFEQFELLGKIPDRASIGIVNEESGNAEIWLTDQKGNQLDNGYVFSLNEPTTMSKIYDAWKEKRDSIIIDLTGRDLQKWLHYVVKDAKLPVDVSSIDGRRVHQAAFFSKGFILFTTHKPLTIEMMQLLVRFALTFDHIYTRFLDLQKAEAQAREAEIEAALERVRSKAMAMHNTSDLSDAATTVFIELKKLGIQPIRSGIGLINKSTRDIIFYSATSSTDGESISLLGGLKMIGHPEFEMQYNKWLTGENYFTSLNGEELKSYYQFLSKGLNVNLDINIAKNYIQYGHWLMFSEGFLFAWSGKKYSEAEIDILERFKKIVELTFRRYFDLQKAEAQAREARIEAALEKVRSKAMAMNNPQDLSEAVSVLFHELKKLNVNTLRCGVGIIDEATRTIELSTTSVTDGDDALEIVGKVKLEGHPVLSGTFDHWKTQKEYHPVLKGKELTSYYQIVKPQLHVPDLSSGSVQYGYFFFFPEGDLYAWSDKKFAEEEIRIFQKFTSVLGLTYRRYKDLKDAEAHAVEAKRQASLDRVRAEIASMRTTEDLQQITPIIWRELKALEVPFIRCGVFIIDEEQAKTFVYLTTPEGKSLGVLNLSFDANELTTNTVEYWKKKQVYKEHWNKKEFITWTKSMMELGQVQNAETYQGSSTPPESLNLHFVPFAQGMLYVGDVAPLTDEKLDLVKTLAEAFSIAYARYEDFKNLEEAKNKIEKTLSELKSAQAQLIHAEKLASLGELTAGIAHEIKNPLNFVNNFSEISSELLNEIKEELEKNDKEEILAILEDLKGNLEKINHHGKRADSIVKGMLLHSRGTSGEKSPTDINNLLDEYVNLAYHGMRAKDKEFNITIEKDYDKSIGKINVVPQDISRAFLNIINNGCYAAYDRKKKSGEDFSPMIKISTKNLTNEVEVRIKDNGSGIPEKIKDKIFQPFFTTKPTGEGTGLGLSLTYDIVTKAHGGELKVETKEGEGAEFVIKLPTL
jgi:signal transduction histidine kinase